MEELGPMLPVEPEISSGEEHAERVPEDMVDPALGPQLPNPGVNERVAGLGFLKQVELLVICVPGNVDTDWVSLHLIEVWVVGGHAVEKLTPDQLIDNCLGLAVIPVDLIKINSLKVSLSVNVSAK